MHRPSGSGALWRARKPVAIALRRRLDGGSSAFGQARGGGLSGFEVWGEVASEHHDPAWLMVAARVGKGCRDWLAELVKLDPQCSGCSPPIGLTSRTGLAFSSCGVSPRLAAIVCAIRSACWLASPPVLDRKRGRVSGGVHVGCPLDASGRVGGDKALPVGRYARDFRPAELWHRDDAVSVDRRAGLDGERPAAAGASRGG
jgi:hypothetical protein